MNFEGLSVFSPLMSLFVLAFLVALTGAMAPGPLLTYTIIKTVRAEKRGYLTGFWVIIGHAMIELLIILFLLMGFSWFLKNDIVFRLIGVIGGLILTCFGLLLIRDIKKGTLPYDFFDDQVKKKTQKDSRFGQNAGSSILGGALVSMANPYWWVWWATIGASFMLQYQVNFNNINALFVFFIGHEAGDLFWYLIVSFFTYFGIKHINKKIYNVILFSCGFFMVGFGIYLGFKPFGFNFLR